MQGREMSGLPCLCDGPWLQHPLQARVGVPSTARPAAAVYPGQAAAAARADRGIPGSTPCVPPSPPSLALPTAAMRALAQPQPLPPTCVAAALVQQDHHAHRVLGNLIQHVMVLHLGAGGRQRLGGRQAAPQAQRALVTLAAAAWPAARRAQAPHAQPRR